MTKSINWRLYVPLGLLVFFLLLWLLRGMLTPFLLAALFAYLFNPMLHKMEQRGVSRGIGVSIIFVFTTVMLLLGVLILLPAIGNSFEQYAALLPEFLERMQTEVVSALAASNDGEAPDIKAWIMSNLDKLQGVAAHVWNFLAAGQATISQIFMTLLLLPVVSFYLMRDWPSLLDRIHAIVPRSVEPRVIQLAHESDDALSSFLRGQCLVVLAQMIIFSVGLLIVGVEFALAIGLFAGLMAFIPYLGLIVGLTTAGISGYVGGGWESVAYVCLVFGIAQVLEIAVLTPKLLGDQVGLHPVAILFAVLAGGHLFGVVGVLVAVPVTAVLAVLLRHAYTEYKNSDYYQEHHPVTEAEEG